MNIDKHRYFNIKSLTSIPFGGAYWYSQAMFRLGGIPQGHFFLRTCNFKMFGHGYFSKHVAVANLGEISNGLLI